MKYTIEKNHYYYNLLKCLEHFSLNLGEFSSENVYGVTGIFVQNEFDELASNQFAFSMSSSLLPPSIDK